MATFTLQNLGRFGQHLSQYQRQHQQEDSATVSIGFEELLAVVWKRMQLTESHLAADLFDKCCKLLGCCSTCPFMFMQH